MNALVVFHVQDANGNPIAGASAHATSLNGDWASLTDVAGNVVDPGSGIAGVSLQPGDYVVTFSKNGYADRVLPATIKDSGQIRVGLERATPDWTNQQLRAVRGSIWPTRGPVQFGPRPGQADNIIDTGCEAYNPTDLATAKQRINARNYTHVQMGPFIDPGYHGQYPPVDFRNNPDEVLALVENWWNDGKAVVAFIGPDGWTTAQMETLEPIFLQPRWQAAMRMIVPYGWEPSEDTSNAEFVARFQWARRVFPNALQYIHLAAEFDAPGNNDDFTPGQPKYIGHAQAWANVVPYLTGFLIQNGPYGETPAQNPTLAQNFGNQFRGDVSGTLRDRFTNGYAGWPTTSANGGPLDLVAAEQTSYNAYWNNLPESTSIAWGAVAMQNGANGFFDSGSI